MYAFTNHFSGSDLRQRIGMMNRRRSSCLTWGRYVIGLVLVISVAFSCQFIGRKAEYKYVRQTSKELFALITARSTAADLDTLRQVLRQHGVTLRCDTVVTLPDGRIRQLALSATVPRPGYTMHTSVGSPYGRAPIPAVGLQWKGNRLRIGAVNDEFPAPLQELAAREDNLGLDEVAEVDLERDFNSVLGFYRIFYRNDFLESSFFGLRTTLVHVTPDYHLDLYPEFTNAVVLLDGKEITHDQLRQVHALDVRKVVVYQGDAAKLRYGDRRARQGLVLLTSWPNQYLKTYYAITPLLREAYPELFANY